MKIIVIGCGKIGKTIIEHVSKEGHSLVIVDNNREKVEELIERYDVMGVVGNGASLDIQEEAGVKSADLVIAVTPEDEINILASMVAKKLGASSTIARVRNPEYLRQTKLMQEELGLSMVVNPEQETADEIITGVNQYFENNKNWYRIDKTDILQKECWFYFFPYKKNTLPENPLVHWKISYGKDFYRKSKEPYLP